MQYKYLRKRRNFGDRKRHVAYTIVHNALTLNLKGRTAVKVELAVVGFCLCGAWSDCWLAACKRFVMQLLLACILLTCF
jgi:hypothetical protein